MKVIEKRIFECPECHRQYNNKPAAVECMNSTDEPTVEVGAIVVVKYGFGWYDGKKDWVINPDVDMSKHGFGSDCSMGFYYVVTSIKDVREAFDNPTASAFFGNIKTSAWINGVDPETMNEVKAFFSASKDVQTLHGAFCKVLKFSRLKNITH